MDVRFANNKLARTLTQQRQRVRMYGDSVARRIEIRLNALHSAEALEELRSAAGCCHELRGDRAGQFAVSLTRNLRLVLRPTQQPPTRKADGGIDWGTVTSVTVLEVTDYHGD